MGYHTTFKGFFKLQGKAVTLKGNPSKHFPAWSLFYFIFVMCTAKAYKTLINRRIGHWLLNLTRSLYVSGAME